MKSIIYFLQKIHQYSGKAVYINLFAMTGIGLLEGAAILLLVPMISMSGIIDMGVEKIPFLQHLSFIENVSPAIGLPVILSIYLLIAVGQHAINRKLIIRNTEIQQGFLQHLRNETYTSLLHADWAFFIKKRKTDMINVLTSEIARTSAGAHSVLHFISSLIFSMIQIGLAFMVSPSITILVLFCGSLLIFFNRRFLKRSMTLGKLNYDLGKEYLGGITDQMNGIKEIKSNGLESSRLQWFSSVTNRIKEEQTRYTRLKTTSQFYYKIASAMLISLFIYVSIMMFNAQAAQLMLIIVVFARLWPTVAGIQSSLEQIATTIPSFKAVIDLQQECLAARELEQEGSDVIGPMEMKEGITCQNVYFRYVSPGPYALENVSMTIPVNQMTAVVGKSGAGKSTLIDMLMGLNVPEKGNILIDQMPLESKHLPALRKRISYVPQDPFLFHTSIRENLLLVKPEADDSKIWEALEFASASEFVRNLPDGLETIIGDRGIKLSGGERQRLVLARAILRNPTILVLDEATSALDADNEMRIQTALERLKGRMTIIVIAHRLSTIKNADQVIVLEEGRVIQKGDFGQLSSEKESVFSHLLQKQMKAIQ